MPPALPTGDAPPPDGALPERSSREVGVAPLGVYVHVPFCSVRCGYCDFNTYTATELGPGVSRDTFAGQAVAEVALARRVLGDRAPAVSTVFFGGGTPTLLAPDDLGEVLDSIRSELGLAPDAEVTTEANPDSVTAPDLARLRERGFTRLSIGMQSAVPSVLSVLDRTHDPRRVAQVVSWARAAGFEQVSLDLIYGTPGESVADWEATLASALDCGPDHVSAYSLIVEDGTALARRVRRGELSAPDEDDLAEKYAVADARLRSVGLGWYEVSNWARDEAARCRHNLAYWRGQDWWGIGPGAHSHVAGTRWWNVKHPAAYAGRLARGLSPAQAREVLDPESRRVERVLLETRLSDGVDLGPHGPLDAAGRSAVDAVVDDGRATVASDRLVLTDRGRLLADGVVRDLLA